MREKNTQAVQYKAGHAQKARTRDKDAGKEKSGRSKEDVGVKEESVEERRGYKELIKLSWPFYFISPSIQPGQRQGSGSGRARS